MFLKLIAVLLLALFTSACAHQAAFLSYPPGARVVVDGREVGVTPCTFEYSNSAGSDYDVTVSMEGYETIRHAVTADEVDREARNKLLAAGLVIPGGSALWLGTLFTRKLKDNYEFVLKKSPTTYTAQADPGVSRRF